MARIIGIDPGSLNTGYGIIDIDGNYARHIAHGTIALQKLGLAEKLATLFRQVSAIIREYQPDEVSIEKVLMHKNADSALKLGQARGCAIAACAELELPIFEYSATQVKQATVGKGHAAKQQMQHMIKILLCLDTRPQADAADALAIALCHGHHREGLLRMEGVTGMRGGRLK